ncbi:hypothetical protein POTOM_015742 [Populus tomentosa]|uniref:Uncharacterized protein n=1 Tax=Populus tomentosa TaxID=118781 RepID=A0A8X7ZYA6_POPTO|nr:hypothetical protein POTOM_015742 [Populus tomentosa]
MKESNSLCSRVARREGWLLLILLLRLRKDMAAEEAPNGRVAQLVSGSGVASLLLSGEGLDVASGFECLSGGAELRERWDEWRAGEEKLVCRGKVLAEKWGGAVMAVMERESCAGFLLVGREDHEFVFS